MSVAPSLISAKLVVWDLDGTLWVGTLDSGDEPSPTGLHAWIEPLARAGVMNAICSNNDLPVARAALSDLGVWDWVIFPKISWAPKAELLRELLADVQLRPEDVVYVDNLARFRRLASDQFGCTAVDPAEIEPYDGRLADAPPSERLAQYRALESRAVARRALDAAGADGFLQQSGVTVTIASASKYLARVATLSERSNQLNFTGSRLGEVTAREVVEDPEVDAGAVWVRDNYGDYGLSGFFARRGGSLDHFFFSCRVLNLGVEAFVHSLLGRPDFTTRSDRVTAERWSQLLTEAPWVTLGEDFQQRSGVTRPTLWIGGCDLQILSAYLGSDADTDLWLLPLERGGAQVYARSSLLALLASPPDRVVLDGVPWLAGGTADVLGGRWETLVLSPWVDCASWTYTHRATGLRIPSFVALDDASTDWDWKHWWGDNAGRERFLAEFELAQPLRPTEVSRLLVALASKVAGRQIVVLTVPEIESPRLYSWGEAQHDRHVAFNCALERSASQCDNIELLDVRDHVAHPDDLHDPDDPVLFHFRRDRYVDLARAAERHLRDRVTTR